MFMVISIECHISRNEISQLQSCFYIKQRTYLPIALALQNDIIFHGEKAHVNWICV